jgi:hypothetical protein
MRGEAWAEFRNFLKIFEKCKKPYRTYLHTFLVTLISRPHVASCSGKMRINMADRVRVRGGQSYYKNNGEEALSKELILKNNGDEAVNNVFA